ncbi:sigma 54-interacting transcriptional regulator [Chondromyces apiculatus]|nr:sigma 54-interacting transcriptional regulator [Chondromyces apiculatus]
MAAEGPPSSEGGAASDAASVRTTQPVPSSILRHARTPRPEPLRISLVVTHPGGVDMALLHPGVPFVLGRSRPSMMRFEDSALSRTHARFTLTGETGEQVLVEDLDSTNGTWRHGKRLKQAELSIGDAVRLGSLRVRVERLGGEKRSDGAVTSADEGAAHVGGGAARMVEGAARAGESVAYVEPLVAGAGMRPLLARAERAATARIPVLVQGETGTGKEMLARYVHERGPRHEGPLICVNCGAISASLVESHLFGHEKGAFTGAVQPQKGVFEEANGGTLFLDELGELPLAAQATLLRVLESGRITRVGSAREIPVDVRVIAATHRDLKAMSLAGKFREDLYFRLNGVTLVVPPLRERKEEIEPLAEHFLRLANEANGRAVRGIQEETFEALRRYPWPGNVRELRHAIAQAVVLTTSDEISVADLPRAVRDAAPLREAAQFDDTVADDEAAAALEEGGVAHGPSGAGYRSRMLQKERGVLLSALEAAGWNKTKAAQDLQMPLRTLVHKVKTFGLVRPPK